MFAHVVEPRLPYVKTVGLLLCHYASTNALPVYLLDIGKEMEENKCYFELN